MPMPLHSAHSELQERLRELEVPALSNDATTDEIEAVDTYLAAFVEAVDKHLLAIGDAVKRRTLAHVDIMEFTNVLRNETDGRARYELECVINEIRTLAAEAA